MDEDPGDVVRKVQTLDPVLGRSGWHRMMAGGWGLFRAEHGRLSLVTVCPDLPRNPPDPPEPPEEASHVVRN